MKVAKIFDYDDNVYHYNVQIWNDGVYAGIGKFCKTISEVRAYILSEYCDQFFTYTTKLYE